MSKKVMLTLEELTLFKQWVQEHKTATDNLANDTKEKYFPELKKKYLARGTVYQALDDKLLKMLGELDG